ncbi:hypothetical protein [Haladaptatus sp. NG-WS-4]
MARDEMASKTRLETSLLDRRSYLRLAGAAVASATGVVASGTATAANYRTITLSAGETKTIQVGSGETFENVLIDQSADGAQAKLVATGSDWTIRNVGFHGKAVGFGDGSFYQIMPRVDAGGTGVIENVYLGDGCEKVDGETGYAGGIWVQDEHAGTLTIRNCNLQRFSNNGIYASGPGVPEHATGNGPVQVEGCYVANCDIANVRLGTQGSFMRDSVIEVTGDGPQNRNGPNRRGFWGWYADIAVKNSDIQVGGSGAGYAVNGGFHGGSVAVKNSDVTGGTTGDVSTTNVGASPDTSIPVGVPTEAKQAAAGRGKARTDGNSGNGGRSGNGGESDTNGSSDGGRSGSHDDRPENLPKTITVYGGRPDAPASYSISVTGRIAPKAGGAPVESSDEVRKRTVDGVVVGASDCYQFSGRLDELDVEDGAMVFVSRSS